RLRKFYNLDMILAVGYRVRSPRGVQFRQWATEKLKEYLIKGFTMDDERLAEPGGIDYFDELLERIRAIRASEKRFYQKVRDIYMTSTDYDPKNPVTQDFFAIVQNKMIFAVTGKTAAELIKDRADAGLPNMGLTTWKGAGHGRVLTKSDAAISKNYLNREEVSTLELLVGQYLDFAELQAKRRKPMTMHDWIEKLDSFLSVNEQDILKNAGKISAEIAKQIAENEYDKFDAERRTIEAERADEEIRSLTNEESQFFILSFIR
ncbi:MAG: hydroxyacid dehydrogenase, partial [Spirochaetae bacterium HGW-Spirochaetae-5]